MRRRERMHGKLEKLLAGGFRNSLSHMVADLSIWCGSFRGTNRSFGVIFMGSDQGVVSGGIGPFRLMISHQ
jgi:hypothetical protein